MLLIAPILDATDQRISVRILGGAIDVPLCHSRFDE
jgi:hypothetical protein